MSGVSDCAWRPLTSVAYVPGIMSLLSTMRTPIVTKYRPLPYAAGPICDKCWIDRRMIVVVGGINRSKQRCPHGGAP